MSRKRAIIDSFEQVYDGTPPWEIGRPQPAIVRLEASGAIRGRVLDIGCGTGENACFLASKGFDVTGIDVASTAIARARAKASERKLAVTFLVHDALALEDVRDTFDTVIDSGLFHVFSDAAREMFAQSLASVVKPGGVYILLCFSEHEPGDWGPRRVTQQEIRHTFRRGWNVDGIEPSTFATTRNEESVQAWLATINRTS